MREDRKIIALGQAQCEISCLSRPASSDLAIFIHGHGCSKESFLSAFERPELRDFSLLAFDLPGFGASCRPADFSYSMEDLAAASEAVLNKFRKPRFHIVAHSMGCAVGLLLAGRIANQLISFINVSGCLTGDDCGLLTRKASTLPFEGFLQDSSYNRLMRAPRLNRLLRLEDSLPLALYQSARSLAGWADSGRLLDIFLGLRCNKAYVYGGDGRAPASLEGQDAVDLAAVADSGHFPMNENPDAFYPLLFRLLRRYSKGSRLP